MSSPKKKRRGAASNIIAETPTKVARRGEETPRNPTRAGGSKSGVAVIPATDDTKPSASTTITPRNKKTRAGKSTSGQIKNAGVRRAIFPREEVPPVTPSHPTTTAGSHLLAATITPAKDDAAPLTPAKRRLIFGREVDEIESNENTKRVYKLVKKLTGAIGGNGSCGPIYGELTMGSMQKMVNLMQKHTQLDTTSRFIDVGSGIGKPNLHVAQDPGVAFSCGIEMELDRWRLGLKCLQLVLHEALKENASSGESSISDNQKLRHKCMFIHGNIMEAYTFDPFTHVYMFSIGFPPNLWVFLAEAWNRSRSPYMICYHNPKVMISDYEFDLELLAQIPTSMHGSKEGHTGYIYQRKGLTKKDIQAFVQDSRCDPVFQESFDLVKAGLDPLSRAVDKKVEENWASKRSMTRSEAKKSGVILSKSPTE